MAARVQEQTEWTTKKLLAWTSEYLGQGGVESPRLCAELLLSQVLECQRIELYTRFDYTPNPEQLKSFRELVRRCKDHEPVQYLTGKASFYSLTLQVSSSVLIPRPETEVLVAQAIDFLRKQIQRPVVRVLDLCTGSGCIAIGIAENVIEAEVVAADRSAAALEVARKNIETYGLQGRITLAEGNLFDGLRDADNSIFDLIVSNPPYISAEEFPRLPRNVRDYEPKEALLGGSDGLEYYRRIVCESPPYLADSAALMVEVGFNQADAVREIFSQTGLWTDITGVKDALGHTRVIRAVRN